MTSFTRRLILGGDLPEWKARVVDYVGLGFLLVFTEEIFRSPKDWHLWGGALALGTAFLWSGDAVPHAWKWMRGKWSEDLTQSVATKDKPVHNVRFIGFKFIDEEPFRIATLGYKNVPKGKTLLGKFESPRLRVVYYEGSTGQEIADMCPLQWWDKEEGVNDISAEEGFAVIASYFEGKWTASELNEPSEDYDAWHQLNSASLPVGKIRIVTSLSGREGRISGESITGVLTLGMDGTASFTKTKGSK
jgi:hypothetical protein